MKHKLIEICSYSVQSAINAQNGGAHRIELCSNPIEGGTTPSYASVKLAKEHLDILLNVLVRPRGGDFCYSSIEYETMKQDIINVKSLGADGVVIGILKPNGEIDSERLKELIEISSPMSVTFNRAFDMTSDPFKCLEELIKLGVNRVLTSGQKESAFTGKDLIKKMIDFAGDEIIIMPGGSINVDNICELAGYTNAQEFHLSAKAMHPSRMEYKNENISFISSAGFSDFKIIESDESLIRNIVTKLNSNI